MCERCEEAFNATLDNLEAGDLPNGEKISFSDE